ncbi:MAG: hypothetical protein NTX45_21805 [Proteobacteria bacterium]|nr:hypothetical protein [Pseudomonadota bacterium]
MKPKDNAAPLERRVRRYETGSKSAVLKLMAEFAIRDQIGLIDALTPDFGQPDSETKNAIEGSRKAIRDFRRLSSAA